MAIAEETLKEMVRAGVHIGHRKSRRHPGMLPFIFGIRGKTEIINIEKTVEALDAAAAFLKEQVGQGKTVLMVGTRPSLADLTRVVAEELGMPFVTGRWIGGTVTNFAVISKRLEAFRELAEREKSGELAEKYTKAERVRFQRQLARLEIELGGIRNLTKLPDIFVLSSLRSNKLAAIEARKKSISVVAIVDTDCDPALVDYPIPANDDALPSVQYILSKLSVAIKEGKSEAASKAEEAASKAEEAERTKLSEAKSASPASPERSAGRAGGQKEVQDKEAEKKEKPTAS